MEFDWVRMAATAAIIFIVVFLVNHTDAFKDASRGKRALLTGIAIFVPLLILNLVWPYSGG